MVDDGLEFNGGQSAEAVLSSAAVVGPFDPVHDGGPELVSGGGGFGFNRWIVYQFAEFPTASRGTRFQAG